MAYQYNNPLETAPGMAPLQATAVNAQVNTPVMSGAGVSGAAGYQPVAPGIGQNQQLPGGNPNGFFSPGGGAQLALGAIQTLGSLWNSFQQNKLAKKSLALQTRAFETNLANQTKTYNTALEDRIRARYATEGRPEQAQSYIEANKL